MHTSVHPTAVIDPVAKIGSGVSIGPYAVIEGPVEIGAGSVVKAHAHLIGPVVLGERTTIHSNVVIGDRAQHLRYDGAGTGVFIGDDNTFRENVTIHAGTQDGGTRIGHRNYFMACSHAAHDCVVGNNCILANGALLGGHVTVQDNVFLSGNCAVHQFSVIGRLAMMSGAATATKDLPPFFVQEGRNRVVGVNVVGMRRAGIPSREIDAVREAFRILYLQRKVLPVALEQLERMFGHSTAVMELVTFVRASKRGITLSCGYRDVA